MKNILLIQLSAPNNKTCNNFNEALKAYNDFANQKNNWLYFGSNAIFIKYSINNFFLINNQINDYMNFINKVLTNGINNPSTNTKIHGSASVLFN